MCCRKQRYAASSSGRENKSSIPVEHGETRDREEGVIRRLCEDGAYGFIKPNNSSHGTSGIFFHRGNLINKGTELSVGDRVQFRVSESKKGSQANDIFVQVSTC